LRRSVLGPRLGYHIPLLIVLAVLQVFVRVD
jgi:hypothetical protein